MYLRLTTPFRPDFCSTSASHALPWLRKPKRFCQPLALKQPKVKLCHRQVYRQAAVFGKTVHDFGRKATAAIAEIEALADEVFEILGQEVASKAAYC